jgi:hypothetical protein
VAPPRRRSEDFRSSGEAIGRNVEEEWAAARERSMEGIGLPQLRFVVIDTVRPVDSVGARQNEEKRM